MDYLCDDTQFDGKAGRDAEYEDFRDAIVRVKRTFGKSLAVALLRIVRANTVSDVAPSEQHDIKIFCDLLCGVAHPR